MKKFHINFDKQYVKVCSYASITVVITAIVLFLLYCSGPVWATAWKLFTAVLRPVVIGGIISYLLKPVVNSLEKGLYERGFGKISRTMAIIISLVLSLAVIFGIIGILVFTMYRTVISIDTNGLKEIIEYISRDFTSFTAKLQGYMEMLGISVGSMGSIAGAIFSGIGDVASALLFGAIFAIYFMLDSNSISSYWIRAARIFAGNRSAEPLRRLLKDADRVFSGYIRGQFVDATIIGILTSIAMIAAGIPNATVIGVLTGVGNLIPYVGPLVGYLTLALVCLASGSWSKLIIGAVILAVLLFVDGNIINPKLLSSNVMIHPLLVIAALIGGGAIGGFLGMIVAVPTAALLKIQFDRLLERREQEGKTQTPE